MCLMMRTYSETFEQKHHFMEFCSNAVDYFLSQRMLSYAVDE